ncbi:MAG: UPF0147 family protein [Candidatus Diapherotrites archaeon]|nr:UPF0147 family protein [Candidatus Diapherotrites archaeon]
MSVIEDLIELMDGVLMDTSVPRNIRAVVEEAKKKIQDKEEDLKVSCSAAIYLLEDISNDINMPPHTRTEIWTIISELERARQENK